MKQNLDSRRFTPPEPQPIQFKLKYRDAHQFINYLLEPKIGAQPSNWTQYGTPNGAARALINPKDLKNTGIYPDAQTMAKLEYIKDLGKEARLCDAVWTKFKAK